MKKGLASGRSDRVEWIIRPCWFACILFVGASQCLRAENPDSLSDEDFSSLKTSSPFGRVLDPAATYALRGVAEFDDIRIATLYNKETKKSVLVVPEAANEEGLKLVSVQEGRTIPGRELEGVSATISFAGEEVELKYDPVQLSPKGSGDQRRGDGRRDGDRDGDGERRGPSKEDIERYRALSEEKQQKLREYIGHVMRNYQNISREERGNMIRGAMIRLSDGRDLEIPSPPPGQGQGGGQNGPGGPPQGGGDRR